MAGTADSDNLDVGAARKVLLLLDALRQSQTGGVIYRQVERMLAELVSSNHDIQIAYAQIAGTLLDAYAEHLHKGSPLQVQVKLLRTRLQPPLSMADLQALKQYIDLYHGQIGHLQDLDREVFAQAVRPLLQAYGLDEEEYSPLQAEAKPVSPVTAGRLTPAAPVQPASQSASVHTVRPDEAPSGQHPDAQDETQREWVRPVTVEHPMASLGGQPILRREPELESEPGREGDVEETDNHGAGEVEEPHNNSYRSQLDARRRDIQELQAGLAQQVLDTIAQNQEFGVLLEVVLSELRQVGDISELENLRWTLIREIEKLMAGHHELADKLDSTHHYLQVIESDSRQLTDELTRVRLLSLTDELTGLPNRRAFLRRLEDEVARVQRYGFPLSLALIDLDKFKEVNDKYGHAGGDEVLRVYSKNILSIFRHHDLVARYGGEEFAVLLPNTESEGALRALNKVKNRCSETRWQSNGSIVSVPTFSAGLALYKPGETSTAFVERVDKALYRAKRLGRNRVEIDMTYQPEAEVRAPTQKGAEPT